VGTHPRRCPVRQPDGKRHAAWLRDSTSFLNPVVRYLNRNLTIGGRLEIGADGTMLRLQNKGKLREAALPLPVQVFLDGFHRGLYPDLEATDR
jgi:hypothetical protein